MRQAKRGDTVRVNYTGWMKDGRVLDSTEGCGPFKFRIGYDRVIQGFEEVIIGMHVGESKAAIIGADKAFGLHTPKNIIKLNWERWPEKLTPKAGEIYEIKTDWGKKIVVSVLEVSESWVLLDTNHPLADEDLIFDVQLIVII